ncbi:MAG TPA: LL-diaminopimelate aminotransferase [Firmicutes bacterium]|nr:LL-diaminopimelate aminotransferase [Bacillota bacterium]
MKVAERLRSIPPYVFAQIDKVKEELLKQGKDLVDLGIGDPDQPTPANVIDSMIEAVKNPATHRYPPYEGDKSFREAMAERYAQRFGVQLDPQREVMTLIGSKEGISHLIWAFVGPGDVALVPDPAYPVYYIQTLLAGGEPYPMPLKEENGFVPDLESIPKSVVEKAKIMFVNYPNNPTAAVTDLAFFEKAVAFAKKNDIVLVHDAAYVEMTYDGYVAPSILQVPGAKEVAVECYSLSKPFNMTGWRIGAAVGNSDILYKGLGIVKTNTDSGQFRAIQWAGATALRDHPDSFIAKMNEIYKARRDVMVEGLKKLGFQVKAPLGSFYIWLRVPEGFNSASFTKHLLEKCQIVVVPGTAYGKCGEGFVRIALTVDCDRLEEAIRRMSAV